MSRLRRSLPDSRLWLELREFGLTQSSIYLGQFPGDRISADKEIVVSTILLPDFSHLTENQLANAPQIQVSTYNLDLGRFDGKKRKKGTVEIENTGRTPLDIRSLQMFPGGLKVELGSQRLMITNDPSSPKVIINVDVE